MNLLAIFGRWASKTPSDPVTLEPTPSPRAYPSPHSRPFTPQPQGEAETRRWLSNPTTSAVDSIVRTRDRAGYLVGRAPRTHATNETRRWLRAPTEENLRQILHRRDQAAGAPVLTSPSFPSLKQMVRDAGVELTTTSSDGSSVVGRVPEVPEPVPEPVPSPTNAHFGPPEEQVSVEPETRSRMGSQLGRKIRSKCPVRKSPKPPRYGLQAPYSSYQPEVLGDPDEDRGGRSRFRSPMLDWSDLKRRYELDELPPRPSRVPGYHDEEGESSDVEIRTATKGRVTRCQRMLSLTRPEPVPAEYLTWALASEEAFSNSEPSDKENAVGCEDRESARRPEPESEPENIPLYYDFSDSDSSYSSDSDASDDIPEKFRLQQLSKAFSLPVDTPRCALESFLYRNPSALYHILTATVPNPSDERIVSGTLDSIAKDEMEMHIRSVKWAFLDMGYVDRKERIMKSGPRVERKIVARPRRLSEIDAMGEYVCDVRTRGLVPSKLRHCEMAE